MLSVDVGVSFILRPSPICTLISLLTFWSILKFIFIRCPFSQEHIQEMIYFIWKLKCKVAFYWPNSFLKRKKGNYNLKTRFELNISFEMNTKLRSWTGTATDKMRKVNRSSEIVVVGRISSKIGPDDAFHSSLASAIFESHHVLWHMLSQYLRVFE